MSNSLFSLGSMSADIIGYVLIVLGFLPLIRKKAE